MSMSMNYEYEYYMKVLKKAKIKKEVLQAKQETIARN